MGSKNKGTRAERELFHMLWNNGWATLRSAGSGSTPKPSPDLIASNNERILAIECKSIKGNSKYFDRKEISELIEFSKLFGAEPWLAVRFDNNGWFFIIPEDLKVTKSGNMSISLEKAMKNGLKFDDVISSNK
ncbi:MAG: Holliday junction resolvase Hjc [Nanoarchaeota archaeon]